MPDDVIASNLSHVQRRMATAAERSNRDPQDIQLVVVSKGRTIEQIREVYQAGQRVLGENRVEEAIPKQQALADIHDLEWHMIGHIQSRKTAEVAASFRTVHSVDRLKIARRLDQQYAQTQPMQIFLECNVSGEESKYGWNMSEKERWPTLLEDLQTILTYPNLQVMGLMTMAPFTNDQIIVRSTFRTLRSLRDYLQEATGRGLPSLSMGMTADFEIAIEEGATHVRIGTAIFDG